MRDHPNTARQGYNGVAVVAFACWAQAPGHELFEICQFGMPPDGFDMNGVRSAEAGDLGSPSRATFSRDSATC